MSTTPEYTSAQAAPDAGTPETASTPDQPHARGRHRAPNTVASRRTARLMAAHRAAANRTAANRTAATGTAAQVGAPLRRAAALGGASALLAVTAFGAVMVTADDETAVAAQSPVAASAVEAAPAANGDELVAHIETPDAPTITSDLSATEVAFTGGDEISVAGESLDEVASVTVGDTPATIVAADDGEVVFEVPEVSEASIGDVEVVFADAAGEPIDVATTIPSTPAIAAADELDSVVSAAAAIESDVNTEPVVVAEPASFSLTYTRDAGIDAQLAYVLKHWSDYNSAEYPVFSGVDCANFASQSLVERGWSFDDGWFYDSSTGTMSPSWASSTAMRDYMRAHPERATELDDSQRDQVKVGDIAQFDWDSSGDRDHTTIVTKVEHSANGTQIWVGGHTKDSDYWNVDEATATGGGTVSYFSID